VGTLVTG
jgi:hypothetical protein